MRAEQTERRDQPGRHVGAQPPIRGYLMHLTHYDSVWIKHKHLEKRFSLKLALALVDEMVRAGLNTLIVDVEDAVRYESHPELRRAYSAPMADYRQLVARARAKGLTVIPKLNFAKGVDMHNAWMSPYDEIPDTPPYFEHAMALVDELTQGLDIRFLHIGMDEDCRPTDAYCAVILKLHAALAQRGLRTVMWADIGHAWTPIRNAKTKAVLPALPRDIVMMPWTYDLRSQRRWVRLLADMGFEVWGGTGPEPANMEMWGRDIRAGGGQGLVATLWVPLDSAYGAPQRRIIRAAGRLFPADPREAAS